MKLAYKIDWLSMTKKVSGGRFSTLTDLKDLISLTLEMAQDLGLFHEDYEIKPANRFYDIKIVFTRVNITISASFAVEKQGFLIVASGRSFSDNDEALMWLEQAIENGWKPTRIDLALDVFDSGFSVESVMLAYEFEHAMNRQKKTQFIRSSHGDTFYVGSRQSEKMLRVYDKAGEQGVEADWVRYEMEVKGDAAVQVAVYAISNFKRTAQLHVAMLSLPNSDIGVLLENYAQGAPLEIRNTPSTKEGREKWLLNVVAPALAKLIVDDLGLWNDVYEKINALANDIIETRENERLHNSRG